MEHEANTHAQWRHHASHVQLQTLMKPACLMGKYYTKEGPTDLGLSATGQSGGTMEKIENKDDGAAASV